MHSLEGQGRHTSSFVIVTINSRLSSQINSLINISSLIHINILIGLQALKTLIFGTPMTCFNDEWKFQSFSFCDMPKLKYGIVQKKVISCIHYTTFQVLSTLNRHCC